MVNTTSLKTELSIHITEPAKPRTRRQLQTTERPFQVAYQTRLLLSNKPKWLLYGNLLKTSTIQKRILNIQLMQRPMISSGKGEEETNRCNLSHWGESL